MKIYLDTFFERDGPEVMDILNYYIENSFAAYPETKIPSDFFKMLFMLSKSYPSLTARNDEKVMMGFGYLRPHNPTPEFARCAEITYFVAPDFVRQGIGQALLKYLEHFGKIAGLTSIIADVSSLNQQGINFHLKNEFVECGRFKKVGQKRGQVFDVIYFQKML